MPAPVPGGFRHLVEFASQTLEATANEPQMYLTDTFGFQDETRLLVVVVT